MDDLEADEISPLPSSDARPSPADQVGEPYLSDPDVQLMLRVRDGDAGAFAELQARYAPRVFGHFLRLFRDRADAEDLTQEVFLRLYRSRLRYQPRARFWTWVFHVAQNAARNGLRSRRRRTHPAVLTGADRLLEVAEYTGAPSSSLERAELAVVVRAAVARLDRRQRKALELHQFHDCSCAEVAAELGTTPKAVKSLIHRARANLRQTLRRLTT